MIRYAIDPATTKVVRRSAPATYSDGNPRPPVDLDIFKQELAAKGYDPEALIYWLCPLERFAELQPLTKGQVTATVEGGAVTNISEAFFYTVELAVNGGSDVVDIAADGVDSCTVSITLKQPGGTAWDVNLAVLIPILVNGEAQHYQMTFSGGVATLAFMTTQSATYEVDGPAILQEFAGQRLTISGQAKVRAYL